EIIRIEPNSADAFEKRGKAYGALGQHDKAAADNNEAARLKDEQFDVYIIIKHIADSIFVDIQFFEMYDNAIKIINEKKETPVKMAEAYLKRGCQLFSNEREADGMEAIKKATELFSSMSETDIMKLKSEIVTDLNVHRTAAIENFNSEIVDWTDAIDKAPEKKADFLDNRGNVFIEKGKYIKAFSTWQKAIQLEKINDDSKDVFDQAIADYTKAISLNNSEQSFLIDILKNRSIAHIETGEYDKAIADCNEALSLDKDENVSVLYLREIAYDAKGDHDQAIADYTRAIELTPPKERQTIGDYFYNRGFVHDEKGEYDLAIADYTQAICIAVLSPLHNAREAYRNRGLAYKALGQMDKAEADFAKLDGENHEETIYRQGRKSYSPSLYSDKT
ncbi:tetratricopeptide repeat protein, partial [Treponema primitia]|uniref:tetratricopeptide repeat protein n=1 Tax=Treponema primitia TaxID=88058 RepID=UPI0039808831